MSNIVCLRRDVRDMLVEAIDVSSMSKAEKTREREAIEDIATCDGSRPLKTKAGRGGGGEKAKRQPSAYNEHTGRCMKAGKSMKDCASEWHQRKSS